MDFYLSFLFQFPKLLPHVNDFSIEPLLRESFWNEELALYGQVFELVTPDKINLLQFAKIHTLQHEMDPVYIS
jgi:hypothetical protein